MSDIGDGVVFGAKILAVIATAVGLAGTCAYHSGRVAAGFNTVAIKIDDDQKTLIVNNAVCAKDLQAAFEKSLEKANSSKFAVTKLELPTPANKNCAP